MRPRAPASSAKQIRWGWFAATRTTGAAGLPRIVSIDGRNCLISQAECWVSNSRKSYPAPAGIDTSMSGVTVVPTTVLPDLMASLRVFIWRLCLPRVALARRVFGARSELRVAQFRRIPDLVAKLLERFLLCVDQSPNFVGILHGSDLLNRCGMEHFISRDACRVRVVPCAEQAGTTHLL